MDNKNTDHRRETHAQRQNIAAFNLLLVCLGDTGGDGVANGTGPLRVLLSEIGISSQDVTVGCIVFLPFFKIWLPSTYGLSFLILGGAV